MPDRPIPVVNDDGSIIYVKPGTGPLSNEAATAIVETAAVPEGLARRDPARSGPVSRFGVNADSVLNAQSQVSAPIPAPLAPQAAPPVPAPSRAAPSVRQASPTAPPEVAAPAEPLTPEEQKALEGRDALEYDNPAGIPALMEQAGQNIAEMGVSEANAQQQIADARQAHEERLNAQAAEMREVMERNIAETQRMQDDMQARVDALYSERFEPRRIFSSPDAAASFSLHTGYAIGAMLQSIQATAFPGSNPVNVASRVIDQVIEADMSRQREAFRRGEGELRQGFAAIEAQRRLGVSEVEALEFSRSAAEEEVAQQLSRIAAQYQGTRAGEVAKQAANQYRLSAMGRRQNLNQIAMAQAAQATAAAGRQRGGGSSSRRANLPIIFQPVPEGDRTPEQEALFRTFMGDKALRRTMRAEVQAGQDLLRGAGDILHLLRNESGGVLTPGALRGRLQTLRGMLTGTIKDMFSLGALDAGVQELVDQIAGNPTEVVRFTDEAEAQISQVITTVRRRLRDRAYSIGHIYNPSGIAETGDRSTQSLMMDATESVEGEGGGVIQHEREVQSARDFFGLD